MRKYVGFVQHPKKICGSTSPRFVMVHIFWDNIPKSKNEFELFLETLTLTFLLSNFWNQIVFSMFSNTYFGRCRNSALTALTDWWGTRENCFRFLINHFYCPSHRISHSKKYKYLHRRHASPGMFILISPHYIYTVSKNTYIYKVSK